MAKEFEVTAQMITMLKTKITAETLEEAEAIAKEMDGCEFIEIEGSGDWSIYDVQEVEETEED